MDEMATKKVDALGLIGMRDTDIEAMSEWRTKQQLKAEEAKKAEAAKKAEEAAEAARKLKQLEAGK